MIPRDSSGLLDLDAIIERAAWCEDGRYDALLDVFERVDELARLGLLNQRNAPLIRRLEKAIERELARLDRLENPPKLKLVTTPNP